MWSPTFESHCLFPSREQSFSAGGRGDRFGLFVQTAMSFSLSFFLSLSFLAPLLFLHALSLLAEQEMSQWGTDVRVVQSPPER